MKRLLTLSLSLLPANDDDDDDVHLYSAHIHAGSMLRAQGIWGEGSEKVENVQCTVLHARKTLKPSPLCIHYVLCTLEEECLERPLETVQGLELSNVLGEGVPQRWATL